MIHQISAKEYHQDRLNEHPSLSASIAWEMEPSNLSAGSPLHGYRAHPRLGNAGKEKTSAMLFGTLCHGLMLGMTEEIKVSPFKDYRSKEAQEWRDTQIEAGSIPVKKDEFEAAQKCVKEWSRQLVEMNLKYILDGRHEQSLSWNDAASYGMNVKTIFCRARLDTIVDLPNNQAEIWDWKTMSKAHPKKVLRKVIDEGLSLKSEFYKRGLAECKPELQGRIKHGFIFASVEPPYLICPVYELSGQFQLIGKKQVQNAIDTWAKCLSENKWPGFEAIQRLEAPSWHWHEEILEDENE